MIDLESESPISLAAVVRLPMVQRDGRKLHVSTVIRWASVGIAGVKLETVRLPGGRVTTVAAVKRFFERLTNPQAAAPAASPESRQRSIASADRELVAAGI
jgi:hypothetical protein